MKSGVSQAFRFFVVGGIATLIHIAIASFSLFTINLPVFQSNIIGFLVAFTFSIIGQHFWTFKTSKNFSSTLPKFFLISFFGFFINNLVLYKLLALGINDEILAISISTLIVPIFTFIISKFLIF